MTEVSRAQNSAFTSGLGPAPDLLHSYTPLPTPTSIRVIEWPKGLVATTDLRCSLRIIDLDDPDRPEFSALSYTWGGWNGVEADDIDALDCLFTNSIICDGGLMRVTENCHRALSELRWRGRAHLFWVDAVCINQEDAEERNLQVAMMGRIYSSAIRTIIWLGERDKDADKILELWNRCNSFGGLIPFTAPSLDDDNAESFLELDLRDSMIRETSSIMSFFSRPWFQRLWTIQEVVLAREIQIFCGTHTLEWSYLVSLARETFPSPIRELDGEELTRRSLRGVSNIRTMASLRGEMGMSTVILSFPNRTESERYTQTLMTLITEFQDTLASDSRDRIFAPVALANQVHGRQTTQEQLEPNYNDSIQTIFIKSALYMLRQSQSLYILGFCRGWDGPLPSNIPTWVPDFRARLNQRPISSVSRSHATVHWQPFFRCEYLLVISHLQ